MLALLPVHGLHQGSVEDDAEQPGGHDADGGRHRSRGAAIDQAGGDDGGQHRHLPVGQVHHPAESVDQGQTDPQDPELQTQYDSVQYYRTHVASVRIYTPR